MDPFFGCGTTGVACVNYERDWGGIEIIPEYKNMAEERINAAIKDKKMRLF